MSGRRPIYPFLYNLVTLGKSRRQQREKHKSPSLGVNGSPGKAGPLGILILVGILGWTFLTTASPIDTKSNDFWWHMAAGRYITENRSLPPEGTFSHTPQKTWHNFEWGFEWIVYNGWRALGFKGIVVLKGIFLTAHAALLLFALRLYGAPLALNAACVGFWIHILGYRDYFRPELATLFFLTLTFYLFERIRNDNRHFYVPIAALYALWANIHGGVIFGGVLCACFVAGAIGERLLGDRNGEAARLGAYIRHGLCALGGMFLNPFGYIVLAFPFLHATDLSETRGRPWEIGEWRSATFQGYQLFWYWAALVLLVFFASGFRRRKADPIGGVILSVFLCSAVLYVRNMHLFVLVSLPVLLRHLAPFAAEASGKLHPHAARAGAAAVILMTATGGVSAYRDRFDPMVYTKDYPVRACHFIKENLPDGLLYNSYDWGGFVSWYLAPRYKNFTDSRYLSPNLPRESYLAQKSPETWGKFLQDHKVSFALVGFPRGFRPIKRDLVPPKMLQNPPRSDWVRLYPPRDWALVFWDRTALIFVRRSSENGELIRRHEYKYFRPDDYVFLHRMVLNGRAQRDDILADIRRNRGDFGGHSAERFFEDYFVGLVP